jgi:hypothetical protein
MLCRARTKVRSFEHANAAVNDLIQCGFQQMSLETDQDEHSLEMHLPYLYKILDDAQKTETVRIVPLLVGSLSPADERSFGERLAPHFADPENIFIVSSDFCHW